ncbi:MAG: hypothetical protein WBF71_12940 [Microthrixaceae bacterium]
MTNRFWDDDIFLAPGEEMPPPVTLSGLLRDLRVEHSPRAAQAAAVRRWLLTNEPVPLLRSFIEESGLLEAYPASA